MRCNFSCAGCGKIQYPAHILKRQLTPEQCFQAVAECGAPMVSIPGGEPLLHPQIKEIVEGLIARKKYVYLWTNALLLEAKLPLFKPNKRLTFSIHLDGLKKEHDFAVCRDGAFDTAISAIKTAVKQGFRVTTNTTLFEGIEPERVRLFFDEMMTIGVEGMMVSPGYCYQKAPDQEHFLRRQKTTQLMRDVLGRRKKHWKYNQSPLFLEFLQGYLDFDCTPWGTPTYNLFGWQRPCYLLQEGYARTFTELMADTEWERYGQQSGNEKCRDCMMHCGYEPTAVRETFGSLKGFFRTIRATFKPK
jgi:hopanoid biosynthesis associated radical SAM protein HpnH